MIRKLRATTGFKKIGHAGTLDPMARGLLILLFGEATKQAGEFLKLDKTYEAEITLGQNSSTDDGEGQLSKVSAQQPSRKDIETILKTFIGTISQTPPAFSAIKVNGQRAYKLARSGQAPIMETREVQIHAIKLNAYDYPKLQIETHVGSGTYIRSLARDIGQKLGTGAYLSGLRRTRIGKFSIGESISPDSVSRDEIAQVMKLIEAD